MSRWGRGRAASVAVPIDHFYRGNSNCPAATRSQGTVGKWGVTSFTSIRSHPYASFGGVSAFNEKKPQKERNGSGDSPLAAPSVEPDVPPPKPKKFFKSRNVVPSENAALPTSSVAPPDSDDKFPSFGKRDDRHSKPVSYSKKTKVDDDKSVPKLKIHVERSPKSNKKFFATKASKKDEAPYEEKTHLSPNKRYLVRNRDKVINYSEDRSDSPPILEPPPVVEPVKVSIPKTSPAAFVTTVKPGLMSPTNKDGKPPIVLRISKGTSRLLSTDSEDVIGSPTEEPPENTTESVIPEPTISPPHRQESLKITIKCYGTNGKDKSNKSKAEKVSVKSAEEETTRSTRASRRNHNKEIVPEDSSKDVVSSEDSYEKLPPEKPPDISKIDDIEMSLAAMESEEAIPTEEDSTKPKVEVPENPSGRTMRHRQNINYNENANSFIDDITSTRFNKNPTKSYGRKLKKKGEENHMDTDNADESPDASCVNPETKDGQSVISDNTESEKSKTIKKTVQKSTFEYDNGSLEPEHVANESIEKTIKSSEKQCKNPEFKSPKRVVSENNPSDNEDKPSVKLVITKKKGSIFKSRSLVNDGSGATGKKRHLYKHKWADDGKGNQTPRPEPEANSQTALQEFEENRALTRVTHYQKDKNPISEDFEMETYTSVKCPKNAKDFYTVVRNVKKAHQIQEIGEFQEFNDDVEYILDALQDNNPMATRCLSAITLASKCTAPAFRMHVRAHGTVAKFFRALHDATNDQSLGLCTATVMFVLSQDRLNMDLDRESLELMLNLLESDVSHRNALDDCGLTSVQLAKNKERVRELCAEIKNQGKAKHLDLDNITVGHLAMETLLSLTSKRAGEWFTEELRTLGGIDHILSTICDCCRKIGDYVAEWSPDLLDLLRKIDRCMRVLENVTQQNEDNQIYLVTWKDGQAVDTLVRLFRLCDREIPLYPTGGSAAITGTANSTGATIRDALLPTLKVLVNLTSSTKPSSRGSTVVGEQKGVIDASLHLLLQAPNYLPDHNDFEFSVCVLLLLMNLMQNNSSNINQLIEAQAPADFEAVFTSNKPAIQALIDHFYKREELARLAEKNTDAILDGEKVSEPKEKKNKSHDEFIEETVAKLLQKAGSHMEHTMVGSYIVLLLGHVVMDSKDNEAKVRSMLPEGTFQCMLTVLRKYFSFLNLTASAEAAIVAHVKTTEKILNFLDKCDNSNQPGTSSVADAEKSSPYGDVTNNSNVSTTEFTSDSDKLSSSMELDSSFN